MSGSRTILELCRALPDSEPELRARSLDFHSELCRKVFGWHEWKGDDDYDGNYPMFRAWDPDYVTVYEADGNGDFDRHYCAFDIAGAKAATDAIAEKRATVFRLTVCLDETVADTQIYDADESEIEFEIENVRASTEPLARAAVAYMAAVAIESALTSQ